MFREFGRRIELALLHMSDKRYRFGVFDLVPIILYGKSDRYNVQETSNREVTDFDSDEMQRIANSLSERIMEVESENSDRFLDKGRFRKLCSLDRLRLRPYSSNSLDVHDISRIYRKS